MLISPGTTSKLCACHLLAPDQCPFWSEVQRQVIDSVGVPLDGLALMEDGDDKTFSLHNQALFMAIASVSGCSIIVDSSKSLIRLSRLLQAKRNGCCIDVKPLHLHRGLDGDGEASHQYNIHSFWLEAVEIAESKILTNQQ